MRRLVITLVVGLSVAILGAVSDAGAEEDKPNCRAVEDGSGATIAETSASGAMDCSRKMQDAVKQAKCDANKGKSYAYTIFHPKSGGRPTPQRVFCKS